MSNDLPPRTDRSDASRGSDETVLDWARHAGASDLLVGGVGRYLRRRRRRRFAAAGGACAVLLAAALWRPRETSMPAPAAVSVPAATATILRPELRMLPDGSTIELNGGAEVEVRFDGASRRVVLRRGEALFQVARDAERPFVVAAGGVEVRAVGTAFAVELGSTAIDVVVTEGRVDLSPADPASAAAAPEEPAPVARPRLAALQAGEHALIAREELTKGAVLPRVAGLSAADLQARLAWRIPRLKFAAAPLADVVALFNEHAAAGRDPRLALARDVPADLRLSGVLRADDVDSLLRLLAREFGITAERRPGEIVLRRR